MITYAATCYETWKKMGTPIRNRKVVRKVACSCQSPVVEKVLGYCITQNWPVHS